MGWDSARFQNRFPALQPHQMYRPCDYSHFWPVRRRPFRLAAVGEGKSPTWNMKPNFRKINFPLLCFSARRRWKFRLLRSVDGRVRRQQPETVALNAKNKRKLINPCLTQSEQSTASAHQIFRIDRPTRFGVCSLKIKMTCYNIFRKWSNWRANHLCTGWPNKVSHYQMIKNSY